MTQTLRDRLAAVLSPSNDDTTAYQQADAVLDIVEPLLAAFWDDGNATGLDGWEGPGIGARGIDPEAVRRFANMLRRHGIPSDTPQQPRQTEFWSVEGAAQWGIPERRLTQDLPSRTAAEEYAANFERECRRRGMDAVTSIYKQGGRFGALK